MSTIQKFYTGEKNSQKQKLYFLENSNKKITSINYTCYLEDEIIKALNLKNASRTEDLNGIDYYTQDGKSVQLKILHNGKTSYTLPSGRLQYNNYKNIHSNNYFTFRNELKKYCKKFDILLVYFGNSNIGSKFNKNCLIMLEGSDNIFNFFVLRTYRGYAQNDNAQAQFNKTCKSDLIEHFYTKEQAQKMLDEVNKNVIFLGRKNSKEVLKIKNKYLQFDNKQKFKEK